MTATSAQDTTKSGTASVTVQLLTAQSKHVVIVMEENQGYPPSWATPPTGPISTASSPTALCATNYYANTHPSIGNYFMLTTGQILTNDDTSTTVWNVDNLARRMLASPESHSRSTRKASRKAMSAATPVFTSFATIPSPCSQTWPATLKWRMPSSGRFPNSLRTWPATRCPEFSFIVPDVDDDAHNGTPQQADTWLQTNVVAPLSNYSAFSSGGDGLLIVGFDEALDTDTTNGGGHVSPVFWGPNVKVGYTQTSTTLYQHQSLLRTVMEALQLANPPGAAASAPSMAEFFVQK